MPPTNNKRNFFHLHPSSFLCLNFQFFITLLFLWTNILRNFVIYWFMCFTIISLSYYKEFSSFLLCIQLCELRWKKNVNGKNLLDSETIEQLQLSVHEHDLAFNVMEKRSSLSRNSMFDRDAMLSWCLLIVARLSYGEWN